MTQARQLFLGVDGGGTGCRARIEDGSGRVLGLGQSGPATTRIGIEKAWASICASFNAAIEEAGLTPDEVAQIHAGIGLAGTGRKGTLDELATLPHPFASRQFVSDGLIACLGAHGGQDGGIVIVGTGSIGLARIGGLDLRLGGYGFPISDEGSGADLGLRAIRLSLRALDGRAESSALTEEVLARFRRDPYEAITWMDHASATDYATFAPLVMRHADQGDPVGRRIVQTAAEQIDGLVRALIERGAPRVALIGGLSSAMEAWLAPDVRRRLAPAQGDAIAGALYLARQAVARSSPA